MLLFCPVLVENVFVSSWSFTDAISAANPRVIDDTRARKLSNDLKRCTYYETCATYGLNVERVFQDGESLHTVLNRFKCKFIFVLWKKSLKLLAKLC